VWLMITVPTPRVCTPKERSIDREACRVLKDEVLKNYTNMSIRRLESVIKKKGFTYRLIKRTPLKLLYSQSTTSGKIVAYEFFYNKLGDLRKAKLRWHKLNNMPYNPDEYDKFYEIFPSDEEFGKRAWTYANFADALRAFE
jgi:hypothetical protein